MKRLLDRLPRWEPVRLGRASARVGGGFVLVLVGVGWSAWMTCGFRGCPDTGVLSAYRSGRAPVLLDRHGVQFAQLHPLDRRVVPLDSLPVHLPAAFLAVEDRRFFRHRGVDWVRVLGAARSNASAGEVREGASTLTMQLARTVFPERIRGTERTLSRKLLEMRVAGRIERRFSKAEILELYLNHVYVGAGGYGVEAGARHLFGRPASELTVEQAALLAAVVRAPAHYDPRRNPEAALQRRNLVLSLMEEAGVLEGPEAEASRRHPLGVVAEPARGESGAPGPYFVESVRALLEEELGEDLYRSPVRVHTTIDLPLQRASEDELVRQLEAVERGGYGRFTGPVFDPSEGPTGDVAEYLQGAIVFLDPGTGDVLALVGGRDFRASRFNRAIRARRQAGSAFKPFVYAAALGRGFVASQPLADEPLTLADPGNPSWQPQNYDLDFRGAVSMRQALVTSLNVPTIRLALAVGMAEVARTAASAGVSGDLPITPAGALGTAAVSPLELAAAYGVFARDGSHAAPRTVIRVETTGGRVLYEAAPDVRQAIDARVAHIVTTFLIDAVDRGTGAGVRAAGYSRTAAGKTGTTQDAHDAWFVGYTPQVVGLVWLGFDRPRPILARATGGVLAAPVWARIMSRAGEGLGGSESWEPPPGIVRLTVDPATGKVVQAGCATAPGNSVIEVFLDEYVPVEDCPARRGILDRIAGFFRSLGGNSRESQEEGDPGPGILGVARVPLRGDPVGVEELPEDPR
jgi:penicillin-binding protein 1A